MNCCGSTLGLRNPAVLPDKLATCSGQPLLRQEKFCLMSTSQHPSGRRMPSAYAGRRAALATMHAKERALGWPLRTALGLELVVPSGLDTDQLGTFSGEVPRPASARSVAEQKARLGMQAAGTDLGLASEGSFGPHPLIPFAPAGLELLAWIDAARDLCVIEELFVEKTNYAMERCTRWDALLGFAARAGFPGHALIIRPAGDTDPQLLRKGLTTPAQLREAFDLLHGASPDGAVLVETDMRAHLNPTRMRSLRRLAAKLARRLRNHCPACACPGFGRTGISRGLPCAACATPTALALHELHSCPRCALQLNVPRPDGKTRAEPQHCPACNP